MTLAVNDPCVAVLRQAVPEFESVFERENLAEDGALDAFAAVSSFADFVRLRTQSGDWTLVSRATGAVEWLLADDSAERQLARPLAVEFLEAVAGDRALVARLGPLGRDWQAVHQGDER